MTEYEDYFAKKKAQLGFERFDQLMAIQKTLDEWYPGQVRAKKLHQGTLRVVTVSASVAAELRMRQLELMRAHGLENVRVAISIGSL